MKHIIEIKWPRGCLTIQQLLDYLVDFIAEYGSDGEVWVGDRRSLSNEVVEVCRLNSLDIILSPRQDPKESMVKRTRLWNTNLIDKLLNLQKQAALEKSHFYVAACITEAIQEIVALRHEISAQRREETIGRVDVIESDEAKAIIQSLIDHLPNSLHPDDETWEYAWNELSDDAQESVLAVRKAALKFVKALEAKECQ